MGDFRVELNAVGGHGCQREVKDGGEVYGCGHVRCPDCITARFVREMIAAGASVKSATLTHWPGQPSQVVDEFEVSTPAHLLQARKRRGSF